MPTVGRYLRKAALKSLNCRKIVNVICEPLKKKKETNQRQDFNGTWIEKKVNFSGLFNFFEKNHDLTSQWSDESNKDPKQ